MSCETTSNIAVPPHLSLTKHHDCVPNARVSFRFVMNQNVRRMVHEGGHSIMYHMYIPVHRLILLHTKTSPTDHRSDGTTK